MGEALIRLASTAASDITPTDTLLSSRHIAARHCHRSECSANFTAAVPSRIERRALSALSKRIIMAASMHPPTLFKRAGASYPPAGGGPDDEAWPVNRLFGRTSGSAGRPRATGGRTGLRLGLVSRSLRLRRDHAARIPRRQDQPHQARHRHHAAGRANASQRRHVGRQH